MTKPVMKAPETSKEFERKLVTEGLVDAKCFGVIDLGTEEFEYQGEIKKLRKIQLSFETQQMGLFIDKDTKEEKEKPLCVYVTKTFSFHEKSKLYPLLKDWVNIEEIKNNVFDLVGKPAQLMISHGETKLGKKFEDVLKIKPSKKDWQLINPEIYFSLDSFDLEEFNKLPEFLQEKIKKTPEFEETRPL